MSGMGGCRRKYQGGAKSGGWGLGIAGWRAHAGTCIGCVTLGHLIPALLSAYLRSLLTCCHNRPACRQVHRPVRRVPVRHQVTAARVHGGACQARGRWSCSWAYRTRSSLAHGWALVDLRACAMQLEWGQQPRGRCQGLQPTPSVSPKVLHWCWDLAFRSSCMCMCLCCGWSSRTPSRPPAQMRTTYCRTRLPLKLFVCVPLPCSWSGWRPAAWRTRSRPPTSD